MNLVQELTKLSKPAAWMFSEMEANMDFRLNTVVLKASHYSETDRRKLISGYKELNKNDLVKRIKREHYLINPRLIIPGDNFESVLEQYEKL